MNIRFCRHSVVPVRLACVMSAILLVSACQPSTEPMPGVGHPDTPGVYLLSSTATVEAMAEALHPDLNDEDLGRAFASNLLGETWSRHRRPTDFPAHLQLALLLIPSSAHHDNVVVHAEATLTSTVVGNDYDREPIHVEVEVDYLHPPDRFASDPDREILNDLEQLASTLTTCVRGEIVDDESLAAMLSGADEGGAECLIRSATERGQVLPEDLVRPRIEQASNDSLALAAIAHEARSGRSTLGATIVNRCSSRDASFLLAVLPALANLSGPDVAGFVEALATAHPDTAVRASATEWLTNAR